MYTEEQIKGLFGTGTLNYLLKKNQGGKSNEKGNTYENFFAVYQLASLAVEVLEQGKTVRLFSQIFAFVDDLIIECQGDLCLRHYQLKNSSAVAWGSGLKSIADDFKNQFDLNQTVSRQSRLILVVSSQELQRNLATSLPEPIRSYSEVLYFPFASTLTQIIQQDPNFQAAIRYLSAFEDPPPDKIECVAAVLLGAWVACDRSAASVLDVLSKAQASTPSYIRSFQSNHQLDSEVVKILGNIEGFTYNLAKGFLHWQFSQGLDEGTYPHSLETAKFRRFQDLVKKHQPTTFEELEGFLV